MSNGHDMQNLDILCAEKGRAIAGIEKMEDRVINEALTVLDNQGPYAMFLYLKARHNEIFAKSEGEFKTLLKEAFKEKVNDGSNVLEIINALAENLDDLLFVSDLLKTTLAYARYHLKAKKITEE